MALTYGFYNSIEGDRVYDAIQFGRIFDGIIKDGVYATYEKGMMVIASANPAEVIIQPGRAWFNHTWSYNDANVIFEAPAPEVLLERIDALVLEINEELSSRENSYKWVTGTPSSRPENPTLTNTTTIHQYPLCYVHRYPETTMIYTRDITNMVGTSECPFATGVLEGIDLDAWINQWDDEFHTWENSKKTQFEAWMLSQETAFTTWYNAFKDQMASDVQEVEDFVDYLKSVLDASTAIHLQEEIDELKTEISSGSHITVTTINHELYGRNVTITESGGTVFTEKFDNTGVAVFKSVPYVGNLTISSTYGTQTAEIVVNTPYYARYEFAIAFWAATVNIVGDIEFAGETVTVKDSDGTIVGTVVLDNLGTGVYTAIKPDTYKFTLTYGGETMEVTLSVTQETTYTVDLHAAGFNWQDWLEAGGVTGSYSSLDDVLADEVALRRLFTVHASVDYMADINDENEDVQKIIGTDLAAKWINLRDYALDTLYANEIIAGYMDTADKYFYGEWSLVGQVPKLSTDDSNIIVSSYYTDSQKPYMAFDENEASLWTSNGYHVEYIGFKFSTPKRINKVRLVTNNQLGTFQIRASNTPNDQNSYVNVSDVITAKSGDKPEYNIELNTEQAYLAYEIYILTHAAGSDYSYGVYTLQFYSWGPKGNVPVMTSNTAPYGEASASNVYTSGGVTYSAWRAFTENGDYWSSGNNWSGQYIQYSFSNPTCVKSFMLQTGYGGNGIIQDFSLKASNDGTNFEDIDEYTAQNNMDKQYFDVAENKRGYYRYYRIAITSQYTSVDWYWIKKIQFYGRELSVSVPTMTSNTTPYGTASDSRHRESYDPYKAFANASTAWGISYSEGATTSDYLQLIFGNPFNVNFVSVNRNKRVAGTCVYDLYGIKEDDSLELISQNTLSNEDNSYDYITVANKLYKGIKVVPVSFTSYNQIFISDMRIYGLDYSEKEFEEGTTKKWLYDHGVELETIDVLIGTGGSVTKNPSCITCKGGGTENVNRSGAGIRLDLTPYSLAFTRLTSPIGGNNTNFAVTRDSLTLESIATIKTTPPLNEVVKSIDVSSINQTYYLTNMTYDTANAMTSFNELWLE